MSISELKNILNQMIDKSDNKDILEFVYHLFSNSEQNKNIEKMEIHEAQEEYNKFPKNYLESLITKLSLNEKAMLVYKLLNSLEDEKNEELENIWVDEALNRYNQSKGKIDSLIDSNLILKQAKLKY